MAVSSTPTAYDNEVAGRLVSKITTTATSGITVNPQDVNGSFVTWPTGNQVLKLSRKTRTKTQVEYIAVDSASQDATTGVVTLGTTSRNLAFTGASYSGTGTGIAFPSGTLVELVWGAHQADRTAFKDVANTFTANQTLSSTNELRFADSATAIWDDGTNLSFKDSTTATKTLAELSAAAGTDEKAAVSINDTTPDYLVNKITGGTGITVTETDDGGDETLDIDLDIPVPVTSGGTGLTTATTAYGVLTAGTTATGAFQNAGAGSSGQFLKSNGASALPAFADLVYFDKTVFMSAANSANVGANSTSLTTIDTHQYTIPASSFVAGVAYEWEITGRYVIANTGGTDTLYFVPYLASTDFGDTGTTVFPTDTNGEFSAHGTFYGTAAAGASVEVRSTYTINVRSSAGNGSSVTRYVDQDVATNGDLLLTFRIQFGASSGSNIVQGFASRVRKISTTAF